MQTRVLVFCLLILVIPSAILMWSILYAALKPRNKQHYYSKLFVISVRDIPKVLSLNMTGLAYICNPNDYYSLVALGVPNLIRLTHVCTGEVIILTPQQKG